MNEEQGSIKANANPRKFKTNLTKPNKNNKMRFTTILALVAGEALACLKKAKTPDDKCYFKSNIYHSKNRDEKMSELWSKLVPNANIEEQPADFMWT